MIQPAKLRGVIQGNTIVLSSQPGLPDGQEVTVALAAVISYDNPQPNGIELSAGGWSDDPEGVDEFIQWVREQRRVPSRRESGL